MSQDPVMNVISLSRQVLRLAEAVVRTLLGSRPRPTMPPRTSAPMPAPAPSPAPAATRTPPAPVRLKVVVEPEAAPAAAKPAPKAPSSKGKKAAKAPAKKSTKKAAAPTGKTALPPLDADARYADTVWIPRILWALAWSAEQSLGPQSAADLARILAREAGLKVAPNNVARAFRDFATDKRTKSLWKATGKSYEITDAGKKTLAKITP